MPRFRSHSFCERRPGSGAGAGAARPQHRAASALLLLLLCPPAPGHCDPGEQPATAPSLPSYSLAVSRGGERFAAGDFVGAREAYRAAYALHPDPALLFNIASTYRREGNVPQAITHYQKFLAQVPADDARAPLARRLIAELAAAPRARSAARPTAPDPPEVRRAAAAGRGWRRAATRGSAFGALLLLAAGTHQALRAEAAEDQIRTLVRDGRGWDEQLDEIDQRGRAAGGRAAAFFVAGSTLAVTSLVLFFTGDREPRTNPSSLALELRGTTLSVRGAF